MEKFCPEIRVPTDCRPLSLQGDAELTAVDWEVADLGCLVMAVTEQTWDWPNRVEIDESLPFQVVETKYGGHALEATEVIPAGKWLFKMRGHVYPVEVLTAAQLQHALQVGEGLYNVSDWPFFENYLEHAPEGKHLTGYLHFCDDSDDPEIWYVTTRQISPGEKVTFNYACTELSMDTPEENGAFWMTDENGQNPQFVAGYANLSPAEQAAINPDHMSPYIRRQAGY